MSDFIKQLEIIINKDYLTYINYAFLKQLETIIITLPVVFQIMTFNKQWDTSMKGVSAFVDSEVWYQPAHLHNLIRAFAVCWNIL